MISTLAGATVIVNSVVFLHAKFGQSNSVTASAMFFFGVGSVGFALLMPRLRTWCSERKLMQYGAVLLMLTFLVASTIHTWWYLLIVWFFLGVGTIAIEGLLSVIVNRYADQYNRTALFAANFSLTHACWLLGYAITALLGQAQNLAHYFVGLLLFSFLLYLGSLLLHRK